MSAAARVAAFVALLAGVFGVSALAGRAVDPGPGSAQAHGEHAPGRFVPRELPAPATVAHVDGYDVTRRSGADGKLSFTVTRDGAPVTGLQRYLGARGHLVALRDGDLAYRHAHPAESAAGGAQIGFEGVALQPGSYRLFLQFRHDGRVHTAAFTDVVTR